MNSHAIRGHRTDGAIGSKLGMDATKKLPGEGFKRPGPLIWMDEEARMQLRSFLAPHASRRLSFPSM